MWRSERQQCEVIRRLLAPHHALARLWTPTGPTDKACQLLEDDGGPMSSGEVLLLRVAFDIWNGGGGAKVGDLLSTLDERNLRAVVVAISARDGSLFSSPSLDEALNSGDGSYRP
jgi:hypothetical protein